MSLSQMSEDELRRTCQHSKELYSKGNPLEILEQEALLLVMLLESSTRQEQGYKA